MATTDTGNLGTLTMIDAAPVNHNFTELIRYIRVRFTLDITGATESLTGFNVWHDNNAGVTTPVWIDATVLGLAGGGVGSPVKAYDVLVPTPLATSGAIWWESFEEYPNGSVNGDNMNRGSNVWSGSWA